MGDLIPRIDLRARQLRRIAADKKMSPVDLGAKLYTQLVEQFDAGRVPLDVACIALQLAIDEIRDRLAPDGTDIELDGVGTERKARMSGEDRLALLCARLLGADE